MQSNFLGVLVACIGNSLIGSSFAVMKVAHMRNAGGGSYLKSAEFIDVTSAFGEWTPLP